VESIIINTLSLKQKNKKFKILFRTTGGSIKNKEVGFGHIFRSIYLSKKFSNHKKIFLVEDYGKTKSVLKKNKIKNVIYLPKNISLNTDIQIVKNIIQKEKIDILIVDKYKIDLRFFKEIRNLTKIVYISDLRKIQFPVELVVNGFIGFQNQVLKNKYNSKCLVGPKYQIINDKFVLSKSKKKVIDLLVTFGGNDEIGLIEIVTKRWANMNKKIKMKVILGPGTKESKFIKKIKEKYPQLLIVEKQTTKMYSEIAKTKFGLCAGGITSYEFARMGVPFGIICMTNHQKITAKEWQKRGIIKNLGVNDAKLNNRIDKFFKLILTNKLFLKKDNQVIDGKGSERIQKEISKLNFI